MKKTLTIILLITSMLSNAQTSKRYSEYMQKGADSYNNKNYTESLSYYSKANEENPSDTLSTLYAGITANLLQDYNTTKRYFTKYITNGGDNMYAFYTLATIYKTENNYENTIQTLKLGIDRCFNKKDLQVELVNTYIAFGQTANAIENLEILESQNSSDSEHSLKLGILNGNLGNKDLAKLYYNKSLQIDPNQYDALYNLGVEYFNDAVEIKKQVDKMDMSTYNSKGKVLEKNVVEKWKVSLKYLERAYLIKNTECDLSEALNNIYNILYFMKEMPQHKIVKCYGTQKKQNVTTSRVISKSNNDNMETVDTPFGSMTYNKREWDTNKILVDGLGAIFNIFRANIAENRRNSSGSSSSDNSSSSSIGNEQKKDECEESENMDIPLENLRKKSKKEVETESKITYVTEIDGWNAGAYWYDKEDKDYYIDSGMNKHHYGSLDDCLRALYIYKKVGGCITKKGKK